METLIDDLALRNLLKVDQNPHEWASKPCVLHGRYLVTDYHMIVSAPHDRVDCADYYTGLESDKFIPVLEKLIPCSPVSVNFQFLREFMTDEYVQEVIERESVDCSSCSGEGYVECGECKHEHPCDVCNGMGEVPGKKLPKPIKVYNSDVYYLIHGVSFLMDMVSQVSDVVELLGLLDQEWIVSKKSEKALVFTYNEIEILAMGCLISDGYTRVTEI
ncbi:hypothetical protein [Dyadobacter bucti]|uniref:hypothetical protein n=1 Tax=Dyadobacter bucti TaxID=2572203 RepID=UPI00110993CC|nr:hypothetical protein [Dyadobacter bucti]